MEPQTSSGNRHEASDPPHEASLEVTLDFLNTDELKGNGQRDEHLVTLGDAIRWLIEHELLRHEEAHPLGRLDQVQQAHVLEQIHGARAAVREIVEALVAQRRPATSAVATVNGLLGARPVVELACTDGALVARSRAVGDALDGAMGQLADPLLELVASGDTDRLRICANDGCRWVFEDTSRTGRKRWCSMASCGNRAKAARHRARLRSQPATAGRPTPEDEAAPGDPPAPIGRPTPTPISASPGDPPEPISA